jgi:hypothetical protein
VGAPAATVVKGVGLVLAALVVASPAFGQPVRSHSTKVLDLSEPMPRNARSGCGAPDG